MNVRKVVQLFMVIVVIAIVIIDVWAAIKGGHHDTISGRLWDWSKATPMLPFGIGVVIGHLFWQEK